jgi:RHS repeat-associated protein
MLTSFTDGTTDAEYVYDASPGIRRRVKGVVDGTVTYYAFDGLNVLADYDGSVSAQRTFVVPFLDDSLVLRTGGNDYHYTLDALGSVANLVDGNEAVQNDYLYEAFGSPQGSPTQNVTNRLRYTGREWDAANGLQLNRVRWYDTKTSRWLTRDPVAGAQLGPLYTYASNDPVLLLDPLGLKSCQDMFGEFLQHCTSLYWNDPSARAKCQRAARRWYRDCSLSGVEPESGWEDLYGGHDWNVTAAVGLGGGIAEVTCCDDKKRLHKAVFKKFCIGPYAGVEASGHVMAGLQGRNCPGGYEGRFVEGGLGFVVGVDFELTLNGRIGGAGASLGATKWLSGGLLLCHYWLVRDDIVGCCR